MKMIVRRMLSMVMALMLISSLPMTALAAVNADASLGDVTIGSESVTHTKESEGEVTENHGGEVIVTGSSNEHTVTVNTNTSDGSSSGEAKTGDVTVTLDNVNIDVSDTGNLESTPGDAAVSVDRAEGTTVTVELEGTNNLSSGAGRGGLEASGEGNLVIQDTDNDGTLNATGGDAGAGVGAGIIINYDDNGNPTGFNSDGKNITITGGTISATGGAFAAGIGGTIQGDGSNINIEGGNVTATGNLGAGIGGGNAGDGNNITISGGAIQATGVNGSSGIGGGSSNGAAEGITISGGTVTAIGSSGGAGIGGGNSGSGSEITISGGTVTATGQFGGAGIGGGKSGNAENISVSGGTVNATSTSTSNGAGGGAGIGSGAKGESTNIVLKDDANVTATGDRNGADIGDGQAVNSEEKQENKVDISELNPEGSFTGSDGEKIEGEYVPVVVPVPVPTPAEPEADPVEEEEEETAPVYYPVAEEEEPIFDIFKNGETEMEGTEEVKGDILYVEAKTGHATFTVKLADLKALAAKGIETVVFMTENGAAAYSLDALLEALEGTEDLTVTIDGETVTLHYGDEEKTELLLDKETVDKLVEAR